ncbi:MAG: hypothetical protein JSR17_00945 [Proteobacteria bacterium]|nr:hypothetical protein [Pseudomonadota bacterium]
MTDRLDQLEKRIEYLENRLNKLENPNKSANTKPLIKRSSNTEKKPTAEKEVKCAKCLHNLLESTMFIVSNGNVKTYECVNEKECDLRKNSEKYEEQKKIKALLEGNKHLPKEEQFEALFNLKYEDLIELPERYRDASIHYRHRESGKKYSWCWASKTWNIYGFKCVTD